jgi:hypothetical protein
MFWNQDPMAERVGKAIATVFLVAFSAMFVWGYWGHFG